MSRLLENLKKEAAKRGKKLLIENFSFQVNQRELSEKLIENFQNENVPEGCVAILREVEVSKYTENLNERIYGKDLWERVYGTGSAENTLSLADHPEDDGSITRICGVWKNFKVLNDRCVCDWYLIGEYGKLILAVLRLGGRIGVSTVGYGDFLGDGKTVDPDSYELIRMGDAVIEPSQGTFATRANIVFPRSKNDFQENAQKTTTNLVRGQTMSTPETGHLINMIKLRLTEAKKKESLLERQNELTDILNDCPSHLTDVRAKVQEALDSTGKLLESKLSQTSTTDKNSKEFREKFELATSAIEYLKKKVNGQKATIKALTEKAESMQAEIRAHISDRKEMLKDMKITFTKLKETRAFIKKNEKQSDPSTKRLVTEKKAMLSDLKERLQEQKKFMTKLEQATKLAAKYKKMAESLLADKKNILLDLKSKLKENESLKKRNKFIEKSLRRVKEDFSAGVLDTDADAAFGDDIETSGDVEAYAGREHTGFLNNPDDENLTDELSNTAMPEANDILSEMFESEDEDESDDEGEEEDESDDEGEELEESEFYGDFNNTPEFDNRYSSTLGGLAQDPAMDFMAGDGSLEDDEFLDRSSDFAEKRNRKIKEQVKKLVVAECKRNPKLKRFAKQIVEKSKSLATATRLIAEAKKRLKPTEKPLRMKESTGSSFAPPKEDFVGKDRW